MAESIEKSGGNVNYYLVDVKHPKRLEPYTAECEDIIETLNLNFAEGNLLKALWRSCASKELGLHKEGQDSEGIYDAEKMVYYSNRILEQRKRNLKNVKIITRCFANCNENATRITKFGKP